MNPEVVAFVLGLMVGIVLTLGGVALLIASLRVGR